MNNNIPDLGLSDLHVTEAIDNGELFFAWQPQIDLSSGALVGAEALIRWNHPDHGILSPGAFLPYITDQSVLEEIARFAILSGVSQWAAWNACGFAIPVSVNVSPLVLTRSGFVDWVVSHMNERSVPAGALTVEITEETLIADAALAAEAISSLREAGIGISIDDFGAGYSSLSHLLNYAITEVKIDRYFVEAMVEDSRACRIVQAMIPLCRELGVRTVGEGVSSAEIASKLTKSGCDVGQGFHISRPTTPAAVLGMAFASPRHESRTHTHAGGATPFRAAANGIQ